MRSSWCSRSLSSPIADGFEVFLPNQEIIQVEPTTDDNITFLLEFDPPLGNGEVGVRFEVISADGHIVTGSFAFTIDDPTPESTDPDPIGPETTQPETTQPETDSTTTVAAVTTEPGAPTTAAPVTTLSATTAPATTMPATAPATTEPGEEPELVTAAETTAPSEDRRRRR